MSIKKVFTMPIVFSISAILVTLLAESNLHKFLVNNQVLKNYLKLTDAKTLTFMIPAMMCFLTFLVLDVLTFALPKHKSVVRKRCKSIKYKITNVYLLIFMMTITSYIMKVNDNSLFKFSLTATILSQMYIAGLLLRSSVVHFIFLTGVYYSLGLMFCFAFMKYFAFGYQMFIIFVKNMF